MRTDDEYATKGSPNPINVLRLNDALAKRVDAKSNVVE